MNNSNPIDNPTPETPAGPTQPTTAPEYVIPEYVERFCVLIECDSEAQQVALLARLEAEGLECRALIA
jgi:hypothetical protein